MPDTEQQTPAETPGKRVTPRIVSVGQIAGAISAVVGLSVLIYTQVKPGSASSPALSASIQVKAYAPRTEYSFVNSSASELEEVTAPLLREGLSQKEIREGLQRSGVYVAYTVNVEGAAGRRYGVTVTMYNAGNEERVPTNGGVIPNPTLTTPSAKYRSTFGAWIPSPEKRGTYRVEVALLNKDGSDFGEPGRSAAFYLPG